MESIQKNVLEYFKLFSNNNPIHYNDEYAKNTSFKFCILPGILVGSLFGGLLGSKLPGKGTIHLEQTMSFKSPVYINEEIKATIEIVKIRNDKPIITFKTVCYKNDGIIAIEGEAVVKFNGLNI